MNLEKQILVAKGAVKMLPGVKKLIQPMKTGGTIESRYCYSVWLRHLFHWSNFNPYIPDTVAELGPGDSIGTGLAALLSGSNHLFALDVVKYWNNERNLKIFEELVELFRKKAAIPGPQDYPRVRPAIDDYSFPSRILTDEMLKKSLADERLNAIRHEITHIDDPSNAFIRYKIPWQDYDIINRNSVDLIYSQAVLECIDGLDNTFIAMCRWLKPYGLMSHTIDMKSHNLTREWNGHWKFSETGWFFVRGGRKYLLNRQPLSTYVSMHSKHGFEILVQKTVKRENLIAQESFAKEFRNLSEEDKTTSGVYLLSKKRDVECS
jgi:hypothetical protein